MTELLNDKNDNETDFKPFYYDLPASYIAQRPVFPADSARLLHIKKQNSSIYDLTFTDLPGVLNTNDLLVFNNTAVNKARLFGKIQSGAEIEILLINEEEIGIWRCMGKPLKKLRPDLKLFFGQDFTTEAVVIKRIGDYEVLINFWGLSSKEVFNLGVMPIPPYIRRGKGDDHDEKDYQTLFGKNFGSIAAPTASLHFNQNLLSNLKIAGINWVEVTLHVGSASFLSVYDPNIEVINKPASEQMILDQEIIEKILNHKKDGGRIIAVGTTVVRFLESVVNMTDNSGIIDTELFIFPGYKFSLVDAMITNFHQPGSSHLLLVEAFMGLDPLRTSYNHALNSGYRFLSYGDGMFIE